MDAGESNFDKEWDIYIYFLLTNIYYKERKEKSTIFS